MAPEAQQNVLPSWASRPWVTFGLLLFLGLAPVGTVGLLSYRSAGESIGRLIRSNNLSAANFTGSLVQSEFSLRISTLRGAAGNPAMVAAVVARDEDAVRSQLRALVESDPRVVRAFLTTPEGLLWSDFPRAPESLGRNFSHRDWHRGLTESWEPYVSQVYRRFAEPRPLLVAVAVPVREDPEGSPVGALVYQVLLEGVAELLERVDVGRNGYAFLLDPRGTVAAHPRLDLQERLYEEYAGTGLLAGAPEPRHVEHQDPFSGVGVLATTVSVPLPGGRWTVVAQQPLEEAYAPLEGLALNIGGVGLLMAILLAGGVVWMSRQYQRVRSRGEELEGLTRELSREYREQRRIHDTLLANLPGMVYRCRVDADWTMEFVSEGCRELTGYSPEALVGSRDRAWGDLIHPDDRDEVYAALRAALSESRPFSLTYRIRTADGGEMWILEQGRGVSSPEDGPERVEGYARDVTEEKNLQQRLLQSRKMESVGRLAGGVAHDFNNMLSVISGYTELALGKLSEDEELWEFLEEIRNAGNRAEHLTRQLLAFSRKQVLQPAVLDLNEVVREMDRMLQRLIGEDIDLVTSLGSDLHPVKFDPGQIEQILMNLAVNARDAMPRGGKLTIETANVELDESYAAAHEAVQPGPHVMVAVADTGEGMDAETRERIFEPFFTTKEMGKGTGLGLATVYGIVRQSGGDIWVYSEPGQGTTFKVYLPRAEDSATTPDTEPRPQASLRGNETVLLVEDEAAVRKLIGEALERAGYRVLPAGDGEEALTVCRRHEGPIHLLLTDVVLPGMGGRELAETAGELRPGLRVLYMSGYTDNAIVHHGILDAGIAFIQKPITPRLLLEKIRATLDGPDVGAGVS